DGAGINLQADASSSKLNTVNTGPPPSPAGPALPPEPPKAQPVPTSHEDKGGGPPSLRVEVPAPLPTPEPAPVRPLPVTPEAPPLPAPQPPAPAEVIPVTGPAAEWEPPPAPALLVTHQGEIPMTRTWKMFTWQTLLAAALATPSAVATGGPENGESDLQKVNK